jgi:DHA1 family bicyclomycin/chloramphenicol resistance-like MFS transporter
MNPLAKLTIAVIQCPGSFYDNGNSTAGMVTKKKFQRFIFHTINGDSNRQKLALYLLFFNVISSAAVSIYIPCLRQMATEFEVTNAMMQMTIVAHLVGEFFGRFLCGPLIESYSGRSVVLPALCISVLGCGGCFISNSFTVFMFMRFVQAIGASVIYVASLSIINAEFENEKEKCSVIGILELYQPVSWILSPFAGCILAGLGSWRILFFVLMIIQITGILFFWNYRGRNWEQSTKKVLSLSEILYDYKSLLKNSYFITYAIIPGMFSGGYMVFAANAPFLCSRVSGNDSVNIALLQAIPLIFYVMAMFFYRFIVRKFNIKVAKRIGTGVYALFGFYMILLMEERSTWTAQNLLALMCIQCVGSAFLVPISIMKALQSSANAPSIGVSTVVVFRNAIMSLCIIVSAQLSESVIMIMGSVLMTVGTVLVLITMRKVIKSRRKKTREAGLDPISKKHRR